MVIENKFNIGDIVYLTTDTEQRKRIVTGILLRGKRNHIYYLTCSDSSETNHYEFEISSTKDILLSLNIDKKDNE